MNGAALLALLGERRSVSPRRLRGPGPSQSEVEAALRVGLRAPDHAGLVPWRIIGFPAASRRDLAAVFVAEKLRRTPDADAVALDRTRAQALDPPVLIAFVARIDPAAAVPAHEQWLAAGAALGNVLNAFHALGFGAIVLSGQRCDDLDLARTLGLAASERLAGFISVGTVEAVPRPAPPMPIERVWSSWRG